MKLREWLPDGSRQFWGYYAVTVFYIAFTLTLCVMARCGFWK